MNGKKYNIQCKNGVEFVLFLFFSFIYMIYLYYSVVIRKMPRKGARFVEMFKGVIFPFALVRGSFSKMVPESYSPQIVASVGA